MIKTIVRNKSGQDMMGVSGESRYPFNISDGGFIIIPSRDEYGLYARYSEIIFQKGKSIFKKTAESNIITETILPGPIKCIIRKNWTEPKRKFPVVSFLNLEGAQIEIFYPDCFNIGEKLLLPRGIVVMATVPVYSPLAKFKEFIIHKEEKVGSIGGEDIFPNHEMKGKRSPQELERLSKLYNDWKESEKNRIKVM